MNNSLDQTPVTLCKNCGSNIPEQSNFCPKCGQDTHSHKQPFRHFIMEALENTLHFDSKIIHTVRDLFIRPGQLTINFNSDKRARYVPPVRFYIFTSFIFFLVMSLTSSNSIGVPEPVIQIEEDSVLTKGELSTYITDEEMKMLKSGSLDNDRIVDSIIVSKGGEPGMMNRALLRILSNTANGKLKPKDYEDKIFKNISISLFFLMPIFGLLLMFIYRKSRMFYIEHLIFSLHLHTLFFILVLAVIPIDALFKIDLSPVVYLGMIVYLFFALRNVYRQSWPKTAAKTIIMICSYGVFVGISLLISTVISFM
jgi:hypothetical protein